MKRVLSLILLLLILFSTVACSPKEQSPGTAAESGKESLKNPKSISSGEEIENQQQQNSRPPVDLPAMNDLFTIEELEAYFGMVVEVWKPGSEKPKERIEYSLFRGVNREGAASFSAKDHGTRQDAEIAMNLPYLMSAKSRVWVNVRY